MMREIFFRVNWNFPRACVAKMFRHVRLNVPPRPNKLILLQKIVIFDPRLHGFREAKVNQSYKF